MDDIASNQKVTPSKRRQGRNGGKSSGQKAYLSENDVPALASSRQSKTPRTPSKFDTASPAPASRFSNENASQGGSKQRTKNARSKPKNLPMPPENNNSGASYNHSSSSNNNNNNININNINNTRTPPKKNGSATSGAVGSTAFAGATFHASPAPSVLPLPSFVSRSFDDSPLPSRDVSQELSPPIMGIEGPTPHRSSSAPKDHESPLDFMFRAHREEKQRGTASAKKPAAAPADVASPPWSIDTGNPPLPMISQGRPPPSSKRATQFIDSFEWENGASRPLGPAFSTPYHDRIKAARGTRPTPGQDALKQPLGPISVTEDPTEALKRYLLERHPPSSSGPSMPNVASPQPLGSEASKPKTQVNAKAYCRTNNLMVTEDDLRRILKLTPDPDTSSAEHRLASR